MKKPTVRVSDHALALYYKLKDHVVTTVVRTKR